MTTAFKSPQLCNVVAKTLGAVGPAEALTGAAGTPVGSTSTKSLAELTRGFVSHPEDEAALSALCAALRDGGEVEELVALLESYLGGEEGDSLPDHAIAELTLRIAQGSESAHARELCRTALDLCPVYVAALSLFEQLADASWTDELCARYQIFLEDAPAHGVSPEVCEAVTHRLAQAELAAVLHRKDLSNVHHFGRMPQALFTSPRSIPAHGLRVVSRVPASQSTEVLSMQP